MIYQLHISHNDYRYTKPNYQLDLDISLEKLERRKTPSQITCLFTLVTDDGSSWEKLDDKFLIG